VICNGWRNTSNMGKQSYGWPSQRLDCCIRQRRIADFLADRFAERYFASLDGRSTSGFLLMGVSCLVIEALESHWQGWRSTEKMGNAPFIDFFKRSTVFNEFSPVGGDFYRHIRCGILHQGETTGGWTITQEDTAPLLERPGSG